MREEILKPIDEAIKRHEDAGENMDDIKDFVSQLRKIRCMTCQWYNDGECLYYDRQVTEDYFCRKWDKRNDFRLGMDDF